MNRQMKRMMQRQGQLGDDGNPAVAKRPTAPRPAPRTGQKTKPIQFVKDVRGELRKVAWPTRAEVLNYSTIVLITLIVMMALIFVLDFASAKSILFLLDAP